MCMSRNEGLQIDRQELKGDAEVVAEGQGLPHVHHTAGAIAVLHTTTHPLPSLLTLPLCHFAQQSMAK